MINIQLKAGSLIRVAVIGSRNYKNPDFVRAFVARLPADSVMVVSGGAPGVDTWAEETALAHGIPFEKITAHWDYYGRSAGMIRNEELIRSVHEFAAFWDGVSPGTKQAIAMATKYKINGAIYLAP